MKKHIVRVIAIVTATLMLLSIIPAAALQELSLPNLMSAVTGSSEIGSAEPSVNGDPAQNTQEQEENVQGDAIVDNDDYDFAADATLGKDYSAPSMMATGPDMATGPADNDGIDDTTKMISKAFSAYEPFYTDHENHPFLTNGSAWMDLSKIYYGAPATQNYPFTKWSANTSVYNITGTGEYWESGKAIDTEKFVFPDHDLINGYIWAGYSLDERLEIMQTNADGTPKKDGAGNILYYANKEPGSVNTTATYKSIAPYVVSKNDNEAYAYNRYDAMQGKYGITIDRNVKSVMWVPEYITGYYGSEDLYGSVVHLSDTPYLYFSTEAPDSKKIAISILIGTPVQKEVLKPVANNPTQTLTTNTTEFEYRWYTITDNTERPGVDAASRDNSMLPHVTISDVVATVTGRNGGTDAYAQQNETVLTQVKAAGMDDPIKLAGDKAESLFVNGAITGCIDFTNILPAVMGDGKKHEANGGGRDGVQYKIAQIRVDTEDAETTSSAARINYLYFGPSLVTTFIPQSTAGAEFNGQAWQYEQTDAGVGDDTTAVGAQVRDTAGKERAYTSGWENGAAVTITNTANDTQLMTIDIHGDGKGELLDWSKVPSGADVLHASYSSGRPSKVWKFTDKKGVTHYMEAECADEDDHSDGQYYVMVTVPVRKWINVLGESRKIYFTATLLNAGVDGKEPGFMMWGNEAGSLGAGHGDTELGARYKNEDMLIVFGKQGTAYHVDEGQPYFIAEVDATTGNSLVYNKAANGTTDVESWFDILRSPYVYDQTVRGASSSCKVTEKHLGYTFVTSIRFAMPIGSAITIQNMRGDGNSAGLNSYSTNGHVVSAYDGGSGVQPEINVDNTLPEKQITVKTNTNANATFTQSDLGDKTIKGTISTKPAAYGPMLKESYYTIYDMLDTERIYSTGNNSTGYDNQGKVKQPIYGETWTAKGLLPIYAKPYDTNHHYGSVGEGRQFVVYTTVILTNNNRDKWGLTGVLTKAGTPELGWVKIYDGKTGSATSSRVCGVPYTQDVEKTSADNAEKYGKEVVQALKNEWIISNIGAMVTGTWATQFFDSSGTKFTYTDEWINAAVNSALGKVPYDPAQAYIMKSVNGPQLKFGNTDATTGHYSCATSLQDFYFRSINGTDLEWGFKRAINKTNNISMGMTRAFDNPIRLLNIGPRHSYPVLYLDYTSTTSFKIGINLRVDGVDKIWYVYGTENGGLDHITYVDNAVAKGNHYGYLSFEDIMTKDFKDAEEILVTGLSLYMWNDKNVSEGNVVLRRCEIWQEETDWLDQIVADNQDVSGLGDKQSTAMNEKVTDSMNVINDAFFNVHDETSDGSITVAKDGNGSYGSSNIGVNNAAQGFKWTHTDNTTSTAIDYWENGVHYKYTRTESYRKNNSNKGWSAFIRIDSDHDGDADTNDDTYHSRDGESEDGVYEYRSSLGNIRVWVPSKSQAQVVFESDRSFNTNNYRYLYYSYSMRDYDTGISSEENDTARDDGLNPGIAMAIKSDQLGSDLSYSEIVLDDGETRSWGYYPLNNSYWDGPKQDNRVFKTTINAAVDLSTFDGIESVNQFVFYLNNPFGELGDGNEAEFYINYIHLSNAPPTELIESKLEEEEYQYYYMMDNTGDRYSARFPTIDNPTGAVSGLNTDNDRVNPIKVTRGGYLSEGTYFNGDPLYAYGEHAGDRVYDESSGSLGYYEKTYGSTDNKTGSMMNIMFYTGGISYAENKNDTDITDIKDYYTYKRWDPTTKTYVEGTVQDMKWSYGRWYVESEVNTDSAVNTMYVPENGTSVAGNLTRRFATENAVLLRGGIMPIKYLTYYDAKGGQMKYDTSSDDIKDGIIQNDNNYYITQTVIFSYFQMPHITNEYETNKPTKYGFVFNGWKSDETDSKGNKTTSSIYTYTRKTAPGLNYFYADWVVDPAYKNTKYTVTFINPERGGKDVWYTREANIDNKFQMLMPDMTRATVNGKSVRVVGWKVQGESDGVVYMPGSSVTITKDVTFEAVTQNITDSTDDSDYTHSVTVGTNKVKLKIVRDLNNLDDLGDPESLGIKRVKNTYYNIPHGTVVVLINDNLGSNFGWVMDITADGLAEGANTKEQAICGTNYKYYKFSVLSDVKISYTDISGLMDLDSGAKVQSSPVIFTTAAETTVNTQNMYGREMKFYTQFDLSNISGAELVCYGTLYTKSGTNYDSIKADLDAQMRLDGSTITDKTIGNGAFGTLTSAVRQIKASADAANSSNQYYLMVTENKGNEVTYYARGYVIYKLNGKYCVAYSDTVARSYVPAAANLTEDA